MSPGALLFQAIDLPGLYALGENVRPGLFEEPKKTLAPLSHQAPWRSGSFKSHDANKPIGLTLAATSGRDFCRMNQRLSALDL